VISMIRIGSEMLRREVLRSRGSQNGDRVFLSVEDRGP